MAAFTPGTHKLVASPTGNLSGAVPVDIRDALARVFGDSGIFQITAGNTAPANRDVLWYHTDIKTLKRWDGVQGNWYTLTPNQLAMHFIRRAVLGSVTDISLESGDLFLFWDASLGDVKIITRDSLMAALGAVRTIATTEGVQGGGTLAANRTLKLDVDGLTAKTLPASADTLPLFSVADGSHRKATITQIASAITVSDYLHSEMFFMGMM